MPSALRPIPGDGCPGIAAAPACAAKALRQAAARAVRPGIRGGPKGGPVIPADCKSLRGAPRVFACRFPPLSSLSPLPPPPLHPTIPLQTCCSHEWQGRPAQSRAIFCPLRRLCEPSTRPGLSVVICAPNTRLFFFLHAVPHAGQMYSHSRPALAQQHGSLRLPWQHAERMPACRRRCGRRRRCGCRPRMRSAPTRPRLPSSWGRTGRGPARFTRLITSRSAPAGSLPSATLATIASRRSMPTARSHIS